MIYVVVSKSSQNSQVKFTRPATMNKERYINIPCHLRDVVRKKCPEK
jgi:hypothetical protein